MGQVKRGATARSPRDKILDAATAIAADRGFDGTSIKLLSRRSGMPSSSIYWHFADKDELIAAAVDRSFARFLEQVDRPFVVDADATAEERFRVTLRHIGDALSAHPEFLHLGLMLVLQRKPSGRRARRSYVRDRALTMARARALCEGFFGDLEPGHLDGLVTLVMALFDGLFVARQADGLDVRRGYDLAASAILGAAKELRGARPHNHKPTPRKISVGRTVQS